MAQTVGDLEADGLVERRPDPGRRPPRRWSSSPRRARARWPTDRRHREGWLAGAIDEQLTARERRVLEEAVEILRRLADA